MPNLPKRIIVRIYDYFISRFGIEITSPPDGSIFEPGVRIEFRASRKSGMSSSGDITWSSSIDGTLGTGDELTIPLNLGQHVIQAGHQLISYWYRWSDEISLTVTPCPVLGEIYIAPNGIPRFVHVNYIELDKIHRISRFRSGVGHNCPDDFEECRSMKHYFEPLGQHASEVKIFSPVTGEVFRIDPQQTGGMKVEIECCYCKDIRIAIYHVNLTISLDVGQGVVAGQQLGTHIGTQTKSDIEVSLFLPYGMKKISYFDVMTDSLFQDYLAQDYQISEKKNSRDDFIISKKERDDDPLDDVCDREWHGEGVGTLENWVTLN